MSAPPCAAGASSCQIESFDGAPNIRGHIIYTSNRPPDKQGRWRGFYHEKLADATNPMRDLEAGAIHADLLNRCGLVSNMPTDILQALHDGVDAGRFQDTNLMADCLGTVNRRIGFARLGLEPLKLLVANTFLHVERLYDLLVIQGQRPAGIILSGSPLMLSEPEVYGHPAIKKMLALIRYCLKHDIPVLGICFGFHLLCLAKHGVRTRYLTVPDGQGVEFRPNAPKGFRSFTPVRSGQRRMVYGCARLIRTRSPRIKGRAARRHPVLNHIDRRSPMLEVHSQYIDPDDTRLARRGVLAYSERFFRKDVFTPERNQVVQRMLEVMEFGPFAIGTQLHPEFDPAFLIALTMLQEYANPLEAELQDLPYIRAQLQAYRDLHRPYATGAQILYNWCTRILAPAHALWLRHDSRISGDQLKQVFEGLHLDESFYQPTWN